MKNGIADYTCRPELEVLEDAVVREIRTSENFSQRTSQLSFQLEYLYKNWRLFVELWDSETIPAWNKIGSLAEAHLHRALLVYVVTLCCQLCDCLEQASSIKSLHKKCIDPYLKSGPFKSYYMPLYQEILEKYAPFRNLRNKLIAHQDHNWLNGELNAAQEYQQTRETDGSFTHNQLSNLITLLSYYVNLCNLIDGRSIKEYGADTSNMEGVEEIRKALIGKSAR
ncbi:MAG: hypothetical protein OXE97_04885 [Gammaproteobacteria bacterium]|nr:hypothetical protein [Gammaproteobacteria bacterium]